MNLNAEEFDDVIQQLIDSEKSDANAIDSKSLNKHCDTGNNCKKDNNAVDILLDDEFFEIILKELENQDKEIENKENLINNNEEENSKKENNIKQNIINTKSSCSLNYHSSESKKLKIQEESNSKFKNSKTNDNNVNDLNTNKITFNFTTDKAGMNNLDKDKINNIIQQATKNSAIYRKNQIDRYKIQEQAEDWKSQLKLFHSNASLQENILKLMTPKIQEIRKSRIDTQIWFHIDMDMFFAAVEIRDNPSLKDLPVAVGGERMIATSNYVARKYGVRSAMPGFIARRLCPQLVFVDVNMKKYYEESKKIMNILIEYDDNMERISCDEAYLNMTKYFNKKGIVKIDKESIEEIEKTIAIIKERIFKETQLTASIGIASNKMLAKICSDINKPDGHCILEANETAEEEFMKNLKIRKVPHIGEKTEMKYSYLGINLCKDFLDNAMEMFYLFSETHFEFIYQSCIGIGNYFTSENRNEINKSISCSETFRLTNTTEKRVLVQVLDNLIKRLFDQIVEEDIIGKTLSVEVTDNFENKTSISETSKNYYETKGDIKFWCDKLFEKIIENKLAIRLIRVKLSNLKKLDNHKRGSNREYDIAMVIKNIPVEKYVSESKKNKVIEKNENKCEDINRSKIDVKSTNKRKKSKYVLDNYKNSRISADSGNNVTNKEIKVKDTYKKSTVKDKKDKVVVNKDKEEELNKKRKNYFYSLLNNLVEQNIKINEERNNEDKTNTNKKEDNNKIEFPDILSIKKRKSKEVFKRDDNKKNRTTNKKRDKAITNLNTNIFKDWVVKKNIKDEK